MKLDCMIKCGTQICNCSDLEQNFIFLIDENEEFWMALVQGFFLFPLHGKA
jgi:hypothetical protein